MAKAPLLAMFGAALLFASRAYAIRTALFPESLRDRAAVWQDQDRIFGHESVEQSSRPIWVHAGDSIATAWANGGTLREQLTAAAESELPEPGSVRDLFANIPKTALTWYAGDHGVFGALEKSTREPWVLISTALAGAMLSQPRLNPLKTPLEVEHPERVRLLTVSAGGNDLCDLSDPFAGRDTDPLLNLRALRARFPRAELLVFAPPPVVAISRRIQDALEQLPDSIGKRRLQKYCGEVWTRIHCPRATPENAATSEALRSKILGAFQESGAEIVDIVAATADHDVLDAISSDCFHPSRTAQDLISREVQQRLQNRLGPR